MLAKPKIRKPLLYFASVAAFIASYYLMSLGIYVEWSASFPGRPADQMRPWAYLYYGLAVLSLIAGILLFRKARRNKANNRSPEGA